MKKDIFHVTTAEEEAGFFETTEAQMECDLRRLEDGIEKRQAAVKAQKKYMRDSHGDMDDEEFIQNRNNIDNDVFFIEHAAKQTDVLMRQMERPYFGKVTFAYEENGELLPVYVGMQGYWPTGDEEQKIYDWRSPVASMYYDFEKGQAYYQAPDQRYDGEILEKKQFEIIGAKLKAVADTDETINDRILLETLGKNSGTRMRSVVATIQKEQNALIRNQTAKYLVVDGRAGSGKTVVAMHRLAWLLYNNRKTMTADRVMILSPNGIFGDYIAGVLPEIGEDNVPEKEFDTLMEEILFVDCAYETKLEQAERMQAQPDPDGAVMKNILWKSSIAFYQAFETYLDDYTKTLVFHDFHFEKTVYTKEEIEKLFYGRFLKYPVYERLEKIAYFIADRVEDLQETEWTEEKHRKVERQIIKEMIYQYAERNLIELYQKFLATCANRHPGIERYRTEDGKICYEDILAVFYLQIYFYGCDAYTNIKHLVIDEMQDYNIFQYAVLERIFSCKKTILGDSLQTLSYDPKETVLDALQTVCGKEDCEIYTLHTAYRSTCEITEFCNRILTDAEDANQNETQTARALDRHGKEPVVEPVGGMSDAAAYIAEQLDYGELDAYETIAILCDDEQMAFELYRELSGYEEVTYLTNQSTVYSGGVAVLPKLLAKGMEFDAVFVINTRDTYADPASRHAYYISCTRALHRLYVLTVRVVEQ